MSWISPPGHSVDDDTNGHGSHKSEAPSQKYHAQTSNSEEVICAVLISPERQGGARKDDEIHPRGRKHVRDGTARGNSFAEQPAHDKEQYRIRTSA